MKLHHLENINIILIINIIIKIVLIQKQALICSNEILLQIPQSVLVTSHVFLQAHVA